MKRISVLVLIVAILLSLVSCSVFKNKDETTTAPFTLKSDEELQGINTTSDEASTNAGGVQTRVYYSDSYKAADVRSFFLDVVYGSSKIKEIESEQLEKWNTQIKYFFTGRYTNTDVQAVASMATTLNGIDGFPGMKKAKSKDEANLIINYGVYVPVSKTADDAKQAVTTTEFIQQNGGEINNSSVTKCGENPAYIYEATIDIAVGTATDKERRQAISKELMRICGMSFGSEVYPDSIFAENPYITGDPSEIDLMAFELLYNEELPGSCTFSECYYILDNLLS